MITHRNALSLSSVLKLGYNRERIGGATTESLTWGQERFPSMNELRHSSDIALYTNNTDNDK